MFSWLIKQVSQYVTEGLERAIEALKEAAALRERFMFNSNTNRKVVSAMAVAVRGLYPSCNTYLTDQAFLSHGPRSIVPFTSYH